MSVASGVNRYTWLVFSLPVKSLHIISQSPFSLPLAELSWITHNLEPTKCMCTSGPPYNPLPLFPYLLIGELRLGVPGPFYVIGTGANASNTVEPGSVCESVDNVDDSIKEGTRLSLLRLNSSEMAVMIGGRQALFIETANDG